MFFFFPLSNPWRFWGEESDSRMQDMLAKTEPLGKSGFVCYRRQRKFGQEPVFHLENEWQRTCVHP